MAWEKDESLSEANYLADVKNDRALGKIDSVDYFEHQNHRGLAVFLGVAVQHLYR